MFVLSFLVPPLPGINQGPVVHSFVSLMLSLFINLYRLQKQIHCYFLSKKMYESFAMPVVQNFISFMSSLRPQLVKLMPTT